MPVHSDDEALLDTTTFEEYHRDSMATNDDFRPKYKGTNFDHLIRYLDNSRFTQRQNIDEVTQARSLFYAHGLELDDLGDELGLERGDYDDDTYRFLLESRNMIRSSDGTINSLLRITAVLLGCETSDILMKRDRDYDADGNITGEVNTINIVDVPYDKVKNMFVLDMLAGELERSAIGDTHIKFVNLSVPIKQTAYVGIKVDAMAEINVNILATIDNRVNVTNRLYHANGLGMNAEINV